MFFSESSLRDSASQGVLAMISIPDQNKAVVQRFNHEVIERGDHASFQALMDAHFVNHAAP